MMRWPKSLSLAVMAALLGLLAGCETAPATGRSHLNLMTQEQEIQVGEEAVPDFIKSNGGEIPSQQVRDYVSRVGQNLASVTERPDLPWEFHAVDTSVINAFALPGGKVFVTRGLISRLSNEAELAGVLGHECGHVTAEHIEAQMGPRLGVQVLGAAVGVAGQYSDSDLLSALGVGVGVGGSLYQLHFGRSQESEADELGVRYMTKLGYNPVGQIQVMEVLKQASGGGGGIEMLQTHPLPQTRIDNLEKLISKKYPGADQAGKYKFDQDAYQQNVLQPLSQLPPPKANGEQQQQQQQQPQPTGNGNGNGNGNGSGG